MVVVRHGCLVLELRVLSIEPTIELKDLFVVVAAHKIAGERSLVAEAELSSVYCGYMSESDFLPGFVEAKSVDVPVWNVSVEHAT